MGKDQISDEGYIKNNLKSPDKYKRPNKYIEKYGIKLNEK